MDKAERERLERLARRLEDDYDFAERAGHSQGTLDTIERIHSSVDAKLSGDV